MPELPEVETTARYLNGETSGRTIVGVRIGWPRTVDRPSARVFRQKVTGARIELVTRRGKFVVMRLGGAKPASLLAHMRMSGSFEVTTSDALPGNWDRLVLVLDDGREVRFSDPRKFGRVYLVADERDVTGDLGCEPFAPELDAALFARLIAGRRTPIKPLLLDQTILAGVGNIYADESLWHAGIHPLRPACRLTVSDCERLLAAIRAVLSEAIELAGTDSGDGVVHGGMYAPRVYGCADEACRRCGTPITRIVVAQRGTHLCRTCQPAPRVRAGGGRARAPKFQTR